METDKYYKRSLIILGDIIHEKEDELTKEQCKVIAECFQLLTKDNISKEDFTDIDYKLQNIDLDWMGTKFNQTIGSVLSELNESRN